MGTGDIHVLEPGMLLNNRYILQRVIGEGGFGITYEGYDDLLAMRVCIKEYFPQGFVTRDIRYNKTLTVSQTKYGDVFYKGKAHFLEEARTLARFSHEDGIVRVTDFFEMHNTAYIVMEYLDGINLKQYLQQNGPFPVDELLQLLRPIMKSLEEVHQAGLIHRDISPDNIMILLNNKVKLMDFGAARDYTEYGQQSMSVVLKHGYAPVEQYQSRGVQGPWTDIYALSATIYKCITGQTPVESIQRTMGDTLVPPSRMGVNIRPSVERALLKGLCVDQRGRYNNMADFYRDLYHPDPSTSSTVPYTDNPPVYDPYPGPNPVPNPYSSDPYPSDSYPPEPTPVSGPKPGFNKSIIAVLSIFACLTVVIVAILGVTLSRSGGEQSSSGNGAGQVASQSDSVSEDNEDSEDDGGDVQGSDTAEIQGSIDEATTQTTEEEATTEAADAYSDTLAYLDNSDVDVFSCLTTDSYTTVTSADGKFSFGYPKYTFNHSYINEEEEYYELYYENPDTGEVEMQLLVYEEKNKGDAVDNAEELFDRFSANVISYYFQKVSDGTDDNGMARALIGATCSGNGQMDCEYVIAANNGKKNYILQFNYKETYDDYDDVDAINYVVDCIYRYCSFSGTTYKPRSYQQFLLDDMGEKK